MKLVILLVAVLLVIMLLIPNSIAAGDRLFTTSPGKFSADFPSGDGNVVFQLTIYNQDSVPHQYSIEPWDYMEVENKGDPEWLTIFPTAIEVPSKVSALVNIMLEIPEETQDGEYRLFIKVTDELESYEEPVPIFVRIGSAVPQREFSIKPGIFRITVTGEGAGSESLTLNIINKGQLDSTYHIYARTPDAPESIDPDYTTGDLEWVSVPTPMIDISAGESQAVTIDLAIPAKLKTGLYKVWVGVEDTSNTGATIAIDYAAKLLITVDRGIESSSGIGWPKITFGIIGTLAIIGGASFAIIRKKRKA